MNHRPSATTMDIVQKLVSFDTVSRNSNLALIEWVRNYLNESGVRSHLIFDRDGQKANLFATIGPKGVPGIVLSGHTDVVPVDGQAWSTDPFAVTERDGRLVGRGTCDMKSFIAAVLGAVPAFVKADLATPVHLAFSYDEEVGCRGVPGILEFIRENGVAPRLCIIGEPTEMKVIVAHKGNKRYRCAVHGHECHSALADQGVNAVEAAAELVAKLKSIARRKASKGPFDGAFSPPYTTVHTGLIHGGTALNIVPNHCFFEFEFRYIPGDDPLILLHELEQYARTVLEPEMKAVNAGTGIEFQFKSQLAGLSTAIDADAVTFAKSLTTIEEVGKISFGTEGGLYQEAGIPSVVCGPGSIEQAHKPDEWIDASQIAACESFLSRLLQAAIRPRYI